MSRSRIDELNNESQSFKKCFFAMRSTRLYIFVSKRARFIRTQFIVIIQNISFRTRVRLRVVCYAQFV